MQAIRKNCKSHQAHARFALISLCVCVCVCLWLNADTEGPWCVRQWRRRDCCVFFFPVLFHKRQLHISFIRVSALCFRSVPLMRADYGDARWKACHFSADEDLCVCVKGFIGDPSAPKPFYVYRSKKGKLIALTYLQVTALNMPSPPWIWTLRKATLCGCNAEGFGLGKSSLWLFLCGWEIFVFFSLKWRSKAMLSADARLSERQPPALWDFI